MPEEGKASLLLRSVSKGLDIIVFLAAAEALTRAGWLAGIAYILISDGLFDGRSIGKKLTGLRVAMAANGSRATVRESILRNSPIAAALLLWKIPFIGWLGLAIVLAVEFVILLGNPDGLRLGDELAKTTVLETARAGSSDTQQQERTE
jgi:uncharacterized RDD family membrane protein YckC